MLPQIGNLKGIALDLLFPRRCVGCGKEGEFICSSCLKSLSYIALPVCPRCGRPKSKETSCPGCAEWQAAIDGIRSPFRFEGTMRQAIHQLKYQNLRALAPLLARLLHDYLIINPVPADVLVPVPLHRNRIRERGYNQSHLLAVELGKLIRLPVEDDCLIRQRHTTPQARTSNVAERRSNIAGAFVCRDRSLHHKQVMLIDDVATSGATLDACAAALKTAGAASAWGLVVAREI